MNEFNCKMEGSPPPKKNMEFEEKTIEISQSKQQRENRVGGKRSEVSEMCGTITKVLTFVSLESQKKERRGWG